MRRGNETSGLESDEVPCFWLARLLMVSEGFTQTLIRLPVHKMKMGPNITVK